MIKEFADKRVPLVLLEETYKGVTTVKTDNYKGAYMAAEYLAKKGRKNIVLRPLFCIILSVILS